MVDFSIKSCSLNAIFQLLGHENLYKLVFFMELGACTLLDFCVHGVNF